MSNIIAAIEKLFSTFNSTAIDRIDKIPQSGGDRAYYRIHDASGHSFIATHGHHIKENKTFLYFTRHFINADAPVPNIFAVNADEDIYIQEDFGDTSLLQVLETAGATDSVLLPTT